MCVCVYGKHRNSEWIKYGYVTNNMARTEYIQMWRAEWVRSSHWEPWANETYLYDAVYHIFIRCCCCCCYIFFPLPLLTQIIHLLHRSLSVFVWRSWRRRRRRGHRECVSYDCNYIIFSMEFIGIGCVRVVDICINIYMCAHVYSIPLRAFEI